jgi:transposase
MPRYVEGSDRDQVTLLPECLDDYIAEENPIRAVDAFVEALDLDALGFARAAPASTGRPAYHPGVLLKIYIYGYLNRVASTRRLERECQRNLELMWLRAAWRRTSRPLRISGVTTGLQFAMCAVSS